MKIAIQGELGSFSHQAALRFDAKAKVVPCRVSAEVFAAFKKKQVGAIVIPIENSLAGPILEHFDLFLKHQFNIQGELSLRIIHNLIVAPGVKLSQVKQALSHPIALAQCKRFFTASPNITPLGFYDTAGSVKHIMERHIKDAAGIAGELAAKEYGATILKRGIEDSRTNVTRFLFLNRDVKVKTFSGPAKVSVAFRIEDKAGALVHALQEVAATGNVTYIRTQPVPGKPSMCTFFLDFVTEDRQSASSVVNNLKWRSQWFKLLGIYPPASKSR
jgi:prephenate dehydratase